MNNYITTDHHYDNKYHHIEKVQKELLQQHKYIESQLNQLKDNMRIMCHANGGTNCGGLMSTPIHNRTRSAYDKQISYNNIDHRNVDYFKVRQF